MSKRLDIIKQEVDECIRQLNHRCKKNGILYIYDIVITIGAKPINVKDTGNKIIKGKYDCANLSLTRNDLSIKPVEDATEILFNVEYPFKDMKDSLNRNYWELSLYRSFLYEGLANFIIITGKIKDNKTKVLESI